MASPNLEIRSPRLTQEQSAFLILLIEYRPGADTEETLVEQVRIMGEAWCIKAVRRLMRHYLSMGIITVSHSQWMVHAYSNTIWWLCLLETLGQEQGQGQLVRPSTHPPTQ